jgi:hypothetical protein
MSKEKTAGRESRIEDDPDVQQVRAGDKRCRHPRHHPPGDVAIPYGKRFRHICPRCGWELLVRTQTRTLAAEFGAHAATIANIAAGELHDARLPQITREQLTNIRNLADRMSHIATISEVMRDA